MPHSPRRETRCAADICELSACCSHERSCRRRPARRRSPQLTVTTVQLAMCGICGVVQIGGRPRPVIAEATLEAMTDRDDPPRAERSWRLRCGRRRARGPPPEHRRRRGRPPAARATRQATIWAIQNGELYNHLRSAQGARAGRPRVSQLAATPRSYPISTSATDGDFPTRLRGMFGLAVWDGKARRAVIARDRLGIKPLYYARCDDLLVFASELKSLLASGLVDPVLDYEAIDAYLTFGYTPGPRTPLAGSLEADAGTRARRRERDRAHRALLALSGASGLSGSQRGRLPASACSRSSTSRCVCA